MGLGGELLRGFWSFKSTTKALSGMWAAHYFGVWSFSSTVLDDAPQGRKTRDTKESVGAVCLLIRRRGPAISPEFGGGC